MTDGMQQYRAGQLHSCWLASGTSIVVIGGPLELRYRDGSLDWLMALPGDVIVRLTEGERYLMRCDAYVRIAAVGDVTASARIMRPRQ